MNKKTAITDVAAPVKRTIGPSVIAGTIAVSMLGWGAATAGPATQRHDQYRPIQSVSYEFGSKFTSGYFVRQAGKCLVTLMVTEKLHNPEQPAQPSAARVRFVLNPGQIAGLDSEEGQSLNFTCGENAAALFVDAGDRAQLVALQNRASLEALAVLRGE
jgi:hypothetical protein